MFNATLTLIPVCLFCTIGVPDTNETGPGIMDLFGGLGGHHPDILSSALLEELLAETPNVSIPLHEKLRSDQHGFVPMPKLASILSTSHLTVKQAPPSAVEEFLAPLTNALGNLVSGLRRRHQQAVVPAEGPNSVKTSDKKAAHDDHDHAEPAHPLPEGIVADGYFYEGVKANGEYFNEEKDESDPIEIHSHDDVSPGKVYDEKSDHPYYVVDKPAEGPAPPPVSYFTSAIRSEPDSSAEAWQNYYANVNEYAAKLKEFNEYYYPYYQRSAKNMVVNENTKVDGATETEDKVASTTNTKTDSQSNNIDRILEEKTDEVA